MVVYSYTMSNKVKIADNQQGRLNVKLTPDYFVEIAKMKQKREHIGPKGFLKAKELASQLHI